MYDEYEHLKMLGKKYNIGDFTLGLFRASFLYSRVSLISFENFLKEYTKYNDKEWRRVTIDWEVQVNRKVIQEYL